MGAKVYIITQITNWKNGGEKSGTHRVTMDEADVGKYVTSLAGKVQVFEENLILSKDDNTSTSSENLVDSIRISHGVLKTQYIQNSNKRPIVFEDNLGYVIETMKQYKPFPAPYAADVPKDVSIDTGKSYLM